MKHSRKAASILAVTVVAALALTGCSTSTTNSSSGHTTLKMGSLDSDTAGVKAAIAAFEKANPDITIKNTTVGVDSYTATLTTQLASGTGPDIMAVLPGNGSATSAVQLGKAGYLTDLSHQAFAAKVPASLKGVTEVDGKLVVAPVTLTAIGPIYNDTAMKKLDLTEPDTFSGVLKFCADAKAAGVTAFGLGAADAWTTQLIPYALTSTLVYGPKPSFAADQEKGSATFSKSAWLKAYDEYKQMLDAGCFEDKAVGTTFDEAATLVASGKALAIVSVNAHVAALQQKNSSATFTMGALPATDNASDTYMPGASGSTYGVNASSKNKDAALKFIDFLTSSAGTAAYADALSSFPVFTSDSATPKALAVFAKYLDSGKTTSFPDQLWPDATVQQAHLDAATGLLNGSLSPAQVLQKMDDAYKVALKNAK